MSTTFRLNADELSPSLLEQIKSLFAHKDIQIIVSEMDETDFVKSNPKDYERLLRSIEQMNAGQGIKIDPSALQ